MFDHPLKSRNGRNGMASISLSCAESKQEETSKQKHKNAINLSALIIIFDVTWRLVDTLVIRSNTTTWSFWPCLPFPILTCKPNYFFPVQLWQLICCHLGGGVDNILTSASTDTECPRPWGASHPKPSAHFLCILPWHATSKLNTALWVFIKIW